MVKESSKRIDKYVSKNNPVIVALRYKLRGIFFKPIDLKGQYYQDNFDNQLSEFLTSIGFGDLRKRKAFTFTKKFLALVMKFSSQTLINEINILKENTNLTNDEVTEIIMHIKQILHDEEVFEFCTPESFIQQAFKLKGFNVSQVNNSIKSSIVFNPID